MALGNNNKIEGKSYSLKLKMKEGDTFLEVPYFDLQKKVGDEYKSIKGDELAALIGSDEPIRDVAGDLVKIETRIGEYEGSPVRSYTLVFRDRNRGEVYYANISLGSSLGRSLANSLLNLTDFSNVELGLYGQKNKETKKVYPAACLRQGDDRKVVKWKYDPKQATALPAVREFEGRGGKKERDYTAQEEFFIAQLKELAKVVESASKNRKADKPAAPVSQPAVNETAGDEDVPF